nr:threonine--tRNA ligase [Asgard group archaeon]
DQIYDVVSEVVDLVELMYRTLGFQYKIYLSTKPEKSIGSEENWSQATEVLRHVLDDKELPYEIKEGEGAFYGPKIDFDIKDSQDRLWQCGTIQLDFNLPERFQLNYVNAENNNERVIMLHRAILGGIERFIAILLEHYVGKLPLWLAPIQVKLLNIRQENLSYLKQIERLLLKNGIRVKIDDRSETLEKRIKEAIIQKVNYIVIIGDREVANKCISVRRRDNKKISNLALSDFVELLLEEINQKSIPEY